MLLEGLPDRAGFEQRPKGRGRLPGDHLGKGLSSGSFRAVALKEPMLVGRTQIVQKGSRGLTRLQQGVLLNCLLFGGQ